MDSNTRRKRLKVSASIQSDLLSGRKLVFDPETGLVEDLNSVKTEYNINKGIMYSKFSKVNEAREPHMFQLLGKADFMKMKTMSAYVTSIGSIDIDGWAKGMEYSKTSVPPVITKFKKYGIIKRIVYATNPIYFFNPFMASKTQNHPTYIIDAFYKKTAEHLIPKEELDSMIVEPKKSR